MPKGNYITLSFDWNLRKLKEIRLQDICTSHHTVLNALWYVCEFYTFYKFFIFCNLFKPAAKYEKHIKLL